MNSKKPLKLALGKDALKTLVVRTSVRTGLAAPGYSAGIPCHTAQTCPHGTATGLNCTM
jgi:hypothetical protein